MTRLNSVKKQSNNGHAQIWAVSSKHKVLNGQLSTFSSDYPRGGGVTVVAALPGCSRPLTHQQCFPPGCHPDGPDRKTSKGRRSKGNMTRCPNHLRESSFLPRVAMTLPFGAITQSLSQQVKVGSRQTSKSSPQWSGTPPTLPKMPSQTAWQSPSSCHSWTRLQDTWTTWFGTVGQPPQYKYEHDPRKKRAKSLFRSRSMTKPQRQKSCINCQKKPSWSLCGTMTSPQLHNFSILFSLPYKRQISSPLVLLCQKYIQYTLHLSSA